MFLSLSHPLQAAIKLNGRRPVFKKLILLLLACAVLLRPFGAYAAFLFEDRTESTTQIATTYPGYDSRQPIYTVGPIHNELSNACYLILGQYEISNTDPRHNIMVGQTIIRHADLPDTRGVRILPATTTNVDRQRYHYPWTGAVVDCPPNGVWYYSLNVYSGLKKRIKPAIRVEQGYGFLQAYRIDNK